MDTDSDGDPVHRHTSDFKEGGLSDLDHDLTATETDQALSEEQSYRKTVLGIRSFMGWRHIPDMDISSSSANGNLFTAPKLWLKDIHLGRQRLVAYRKTSFVKVRKSQSKWYGLHPNKEK